jgi:hypothetical protein
MTDYWLTEAAIVAAKVLDARDVPTPPLCNPKQDRCDHGFVDRGAGLCEICDPKLAARIAQKRAARLEDQRRYASAIRERRRIGG